MKQEQAVQIAYLLFRVVAGLLFMQHGGQKIFDWFRGNDCCHRVGKLHD